MTKKMMAMVITAAMAATMTAGTAYAQTEYKVGVVQFMDHASLNQIQDNLEKQLDKLGEENDVKFNYEDYSFNSQGDATTLNQIGAELVSDEVDVIVAIATPSAQIMQSAAEDTEIPIVFSACSDPVGAGLVESMDAPGGNVTGTSDALNTTAMIDLMQAQNPDLDYVGLLYSKSEDASTQAIADAKAYLDEKGIKYIEKTGTSADEVSTADDALIAEKVGAIFTPTDNTIMNAELSFFEELNEAGIPHYAGADSFALNGGFLGFGINYADLGVATADMVKEILVDGKAVSELAVKTFDNGIATINTDTADALGIDVEEVKKAFEPYCSAIEETKTAQEFEEATE